MEIDEELQSCLARICLDAKFSRSRRSVALLRYLVEMSVSGRSGEIKEYSIGVDVLGRSPHFDTRIDTSVRVEMNRLRNRLTAYYASAGANDALRISIPTGSYIPELVTLPPSKTDSLAPLSSTSIEALAPSSDALSPSIEALPPSIEALPPSVPVVAPVLKTYGSVGPLPRWVRWKVLLLSVIGLASAVAVIGFLVWRSTNERALSFTGLNHQPYLPSPIFRSFPALAADGSWWVYSDDATPDGQLQLWRENRNGNPNRTVLTTGGCPKISPAVSPDGNWIAYREDCAQGGVYLIGSRAPVQPRLIAHFGRDPSFSPDSRFITYWIQDPLTRFGRVYVAPLNRSAEPLAIAREFDDAHFSVWTPDARKILICGTRRSGSGPKEDHDLWLVEPPNEQGGISSFALKLGVFDALREQRISIAHDGLSASNLTWMGNHLFLGVNSHGRQEIWTIAFDREWRISGKPHRMVSHRRYSAHPVAAPGLLAYAAGSVLTHVWQIPLDADLVRVTGQLRRLGAEQALSPSASHDGKAVAVLVPPRSAHSDEYEIHLMDQNGRLNQLSSMGALTRRMKMAPDGKLVFYRVMVPDGPIRRQAIYETPLPAGPPRLVCPDCGAPTDVSRDGDLLIYEAPNTINRLGAFRRSTGERWEFLEHPSHSVTSGVISPDQRWIAFAENNMRDGQHITIAPFTGARRISPEQWIPIDRSGAQNEQPQWSPDGRTLYYLSDADGWWCIRARHFDPTIGNPLGPPFDVFHFHSYRLSPFRLSKRPKHLIGFTITARSAILALMETESDVETIDVP